MIRRYFLSSFFIAVFALAGCGSGTGISADVVQTQASSPMTEPAPQPDVSVDMVKIAAWNLEHFTDPFDNPYIDNTEFENNGPSKSQEQLKLLAQAIIAMDADVIVFTEVEGEAGMKLFAQTFLPDSMEYTEFASAESDDWYQNVVVMSRLPLGPLVSFQTTASPIVGDDEWQDWMNDRVLMVEVRPQPNYAFLLSANHLKAGRRNRDTGYRMGQIQLIHQFFERELKVDPARNLVIAGDLNLTPTEPEYEVLMGNGALKLKDLLAEWDYPPTHPTDNPRRILDYIIINDNMLEEYVRGSAAVAMPLPREQMARISDHLPVVASFYPNEM